jgi:hypothetical protein
MEGSPRTTECISEAANQEVRMAGECVEKSSGRLPEKESRYLPNAIKLLGVRNAVTTIQGEVVLSRAF